MFRGSRACAVTVLAGVVAASAGCGGQSAAAPGSGPPPRVAMRALAFTPTTARGRVGQRVSWTNEDTSSHNVTYVSGPRFASSSTLRPRDGRFAIQLTRPGTIHYVCTLHPWMKATIVVAP